MLKLTRQFATKRKAVLTLTQSAVDRLKQLEKDSKYLKIGTKKKGCSGLSYSMEYVDQINKFDEKVEQDGVTVVVDSKALFSLIGSEMDFQKDTLSSQFTFKNPNVKEMCGCGESFMV
ncbi:Iron-sulfur assembly protein 1 [Terramyces sp. JEL0728]|nr:Iron-sulfur assembly protein 1 [Terramyces sp. JEL0728]